MKHIKPSQHNVNTKQPRHFTKWSSIDVLQESPLPTPPNLMVAQQSPLRASGKRLLNHLPRPIRLLSLAILTRARDPEPEVEYTYRQSTVAQVIAPGWLPLLALTSAVGMFLVAYGFSVSLYGGPGLRIFFYAGLALIFTPTAVRLISPSASRLERVCLVCLAGIGCYLIKVMVSPLHFSFYDEFLHWRTADDIARSGHLFTPNTLLPVSPYYPGLEIVTNAVSTLTSFNTFTSGLIVIGIAHMLLTLTLFALNEQVLKSARMAGIATILYMSNPHFLLFDSQFAYESLALPLALFVMFAMEPHQWVSIRLHHLIPVAPFVMFGKAGYKGLKNDLRWVTLTGWIALGAVIVTHHVTDIFFVGLLVIWTIVYGLLHPTPILRSNLTKTALLGVVLTVAWICLKGNPVVGYISSFLENALNELGHIVSGTGGARHLFVSYNGQSTPFEERILTAFSVLVVLFCLPFGLLCLWQRYHFNALTSTFAVVSLFYPISQVFRFTNSGSELTDRAAAFLFIPIATVLAIFIIQFWPIRRLNRWKTALIVGTMSLVFLGGTTLGAGPSLSVLPGPYTVEADARSIEPEGIQTAQWIYSHIGSYNRIATDRTNQILMGTYGGTQHVVTSIGDNVDISSVFFASSLGPNELATLKSSQARYFIVDLRMTKALPLLGFYFVEGEPSSYQRTTPINMASLTKFSSIPQINREFDSGDIVIYDMERLLNAPQKP